MVFPSGIFHLPIQRLRGIQELTGYANFHIFSAVFVWFPLKRDWSKTVAEEGPDRYHAGQAVFKEPLAPRAYDLSGDVHPFSDAFVSKTLSRQQNDLGPDDLEI